MENVLLSVVTVYLGTSMFRMMYIVYINKYTYTGVCESSYVSFYSAHPIEKKTDEFIP